MGFRVLFPTYHLNKGLSGTAAHHEDDKKDFCDHEIDNVRHEARA
jgi:hypothetical protein